MFRLYTKTGDDGTTGLLGGLRVSKDNLRVEAYGNADETNAAAGCAASSCREGDERLHEILLALQSRLFELGSELATPPGPGTVDQVVMLDAAAVKEAENWIDEIDGGNEKMKNFVLPGGCELASRLHVARCIARRCERSMITLHAVEQLNEQSMQWINRLSDLFFAMARAANRLHGIDDHPWKGGG